MSNILKFTNDSFGEVRVIKGTNDEPWFVGKDVARILGYNNPRKAIIDHIDEDDKGVTKCDTLGGTQNLTIINESGLYSLIFGSKLEKAKEFKHWVTSEVLPSIRKSGSYSIPRDDFDFETHKKLVSVDIVKHIYNLDEIETTKKMMIAFEDNPEVLKLLPTTFDVESLYKPSTDLLVGRMSAISFNKMLLADGYLAQETRKTSNGKEKKYYVVTEKGKPYGKNVASLHNPNEVSPRWNVNKFEELFRLVNEEELVECA